MLSFVNIFLWIYLWRHSRAEECPKHYIEISPDADVIVTGMFDVHEKESSGLCGETLRPEGVHRLQAFSYALEYLNSVDVAPGVTFGKNRDSVRIIADKENVY